MKKAFLTRGFAKLDELIAQPEVERLCAIYDELLRDRSRTGSLRSDLAGGTHAGKVEKITQIMLPGRLEPALRKSLAYERAAPWAQELLGADMELDFDMLIDKAPFTDTPTPWHQDAAYWIDLPDKRAVSCWIALDEATEANGCMWFIPKNDREALENHESLPGGGALFCKPDTTGAECVPLPPGGCTFHDGFTLHFSQGNRTAGHRRALILNFRPQAMIELERAQGFDHSGARKVRNNA